MAWLRRLFSRKRLEVDLDKELRFHFESQVADHVVRVASARCSLRASPAAYLPSVLSIEIGRLICRRI